MSCIFCCFGIIWIKSICVIKLFYLLFHLIWGMVRIRIAFGMVLSTIYFPLFHDPGLVWLSPHLHLICFPFKTINNLYIFLRFCVLAQRRSNFLALHSSVVIEVGWVTVLHCFERGRSRGRRRRRTNWRFSDLSLCYFRDVFWRLLKSW